MRTVFSGRVRRRPWAVRAWPIWDLPGWLIAFILAVTVVDLAAIGVAATLAPASLRDLLLFGALLMCTAATVELTKRLGENAGVIKDVYAVWELPLAVLLPPVYALAVPIFRLGLTQWRVRRIPLHRRVFTAAVIGLSYLGASAVFHAMSGQGFENTAIPRASATGWVAAVAAAGAVQWLINVGLMVPAIRSSDPTIRVHDIFFARERLQNDVAELCVAVLVTLGIAITPLAIVFAFPFVTLLQRSFRHVQLVNASRVDSKTGLLNAGTWEREAASEVARAVRTRTPLAIALIDVDHFKAVNDANGHLAGDKALKEIARTLKMFLREYDLVGRFGGEEFALLLPQTCAVDAYRIAERIRTHISATPIDVRGGSQGDLVKLSVSIGVAALGARWDTASGSQLTDLLAGADSALYQAKRDGRDRVCVLTENATYETGKGGPAGHPAEELSPRAVKAEGASLPAPRVDGRGLLRLHLFK